ncbi:MULTISPECIES: glycosyltransferase family 2 protein [Synergistaceae]|uniref:glycosyltransferase family 2 protein n=2 Tax=Cloacibacillus evryensis TaxID=508460 RepID=UPI000240D956|nr:hypothetical protein HMPREF1006_02583 [Synergistes sp. 3_1_syn1]
MQVSIIMSTYNGEKYLIEQIDSILSQTCPVQLFVRDDGSADATHDILDYYQDKGKLTWYEGENLGAGKSFFDAVLHAPEAEYYAFADQDDYWLPEKIEKAIDKIKTIDNDNVPILYCSDPIPTDAELHPLCIKRKTSAYPEITLGLALMESIAPGCTFVFNRKALLEFRKFPIEGIDIHDWALYRIVCALDGIVIRDDSSYILYRQHGSNCIGFQQRNFSHWVNRFKRLKKNKGIRSVFARYLLNCYGDALSKNNKKLLMEIVGYNKTLLKKNRLIFSNDLRMSHHVDSVILKCLIFLNLM